MLVVDDRRHHDTQPLTDAAAAARAPHDNCKRVPNVPEHITVNPAEGSGSPNTGPYPYGVITTFSGLLEALQALARQKQGSERQGNTGGSVGWLQERSTPPAKAR
jgi:hypothetical protein